MGLSPVHAQTVVDFSDIPGFANVSGDPSWTFTTDIDGISTDVTLTPGGDGSGYLLFEASTFGIVGVVGGTGANASIESRTNEFLQVQLAPTTESNVLYEITEGLVVGAAANSNDLVVAGFTNSSNTLTYGSGTVVQQTIPALPDPEVEGTVVNLSGATGVDSLSVYVRQLGQTPDPTEGVFLFEFTATATVVPEPTTGALLLAGLSYLAIRRRR